MIKLQMLSMKLPISNRRFWIASLASLLVVAAMLVPVPLTMVAQRERHIQMQARSFAFEPAVLHVNLGDTVVMEVQSVDVVHGLYVDGYAVQAELEPGRSTEVRFVADRLGRFKFRCSVSCGSLHPFMVGEIVVEPNLPFWRAGAVLLLVVICATAMFRDQHPAIDDRWSGKGSMMTTGT